MTVKSKHEENVGLNAPKRLYVIKHVFINSHAALAWWQLVHCSASVLLFVSKSFGKLRFRETSWQSYPKITVTHCAYPPRIAAEICRNRFVWSWRDRFMFLTHRLRNSRAAWRQHGTLHDKNPYLVRTGRWRPISLFLFRDNSSSFRVWQETSPTYSPSRSRCWSWPLDNAYHFSCLAT